MNHPLTHHAAQRSQQRGVPPLVIDWLLGYGQEAFDGHGGIVRYFDSRAIRKLERDIGHTPLRRMSEYLRCYLVQASGDGCVITVGKRFRGAHITRH